LDDLLYLALVLREEEAALRLVRKVFRKLLEVLQELPRGFFPGFGVVLGYVSR
jgi:hypothetical protein